MARIDWLGDMGTGFGKAVLGIALNFGVFLPLVRDGKDRLGRMGERNARRGYGKKGEGRRLRKDGQGEEEANVKLGRSSLLLLMKNLKSELTQKEIDDII